MGGEITRLLASASSQTRDDTCKYKLEGMYQVLLSFVCKHRDTPNAELHTNLINIADWLRGDAKRSPKKGKSFKPLSASGV